MPANTTCVHGRVRALNGMLLCKLPLLTVEFSRYTLAIKEVDVLETDFLVCLPPASSEIVKRHASQPQPTPSGVRCTLCNEVAPVEVAKCAEMTPRSRPLSAVLRTNDDESRAEKEEGVSL